MPTDTLLSSDISTLPRDQLVAVPVGLLQDIIEAHQSLKEEVASLREEIAVLQDERAQGREEITSLKARITVVEAVEEQDVDRIYCDIAQDRQRIARLEKPPEPQPTQKDRAEILRALLAANNGKMLASEARKKMRLSAERFSNLLTVCDFIDRKPYHMDRRKDIIILKSELVRPNY